MAKRARKPKNDVSVKLIRGNKISNTSKPDVESLKEMVKLGEKKEKVVKAALLISRVDHPVVVKYADRVIRVSPRAKLKVADHSKLESPLPKGLVLKR